MIDPETGKVLGELIPVVRETLGTVPSDVIGILGGDLLHEVRIRNLDRLKTRTRKILHDRGKNENFEEVSPSLLLPLATEAINESREELLELWARLMAAAADPARRNAVRKSFITAVKEFDPIDALVFQTLWRVQNGAPNSRDYIAGVLKVGSDAVAVSFENLMKRGCVINPSPQFSAGGTYPGESPSFTGFGRELARTLFD